MKELAKILAKMWRWVRTILTVVFVTTTVLVCFSIKWMFDTWVNLSVDELIFQLTAPLEGTNQDLISEYINVCVSPAILIMMVIIILFVVWRKEKKYYIAMGAEIIISSVVLLIALNSLWIKLDIGDYIKAKGTASDFIEINYVNPAETKLTFPEQKRNLIYIFLESMEITYTDKENGGAFEQNVIPELTQIAQENEDFSGNTKELNGAYSMYGSTWTTGGMFAQSSGLPLNVSFDASNIDTQEKFFPGIKTLGDILNQEGYSQTLMIGSEARFGGRELYFTEHGEYDIVDYKYAIKSGKIPQGYKVFWGYEDQKLFDFAKEKLFELNEQGAPFNLTLLTVDTHFEDGYLCEACAEDFGEDQYSNVMACSSRQVDEFVDWVKQQSFYENTTIVLMGDHLTMDSDYCINVDGEYSRKVYTAYINPAQEISSDRSREYTTFDSFPTTLSALGVEIEGERLGLGTNLFSDKRTLIEQYGYKQLNEELKKKSEFIDKLANFEDENEVILIRNGEKPGADIWVDAYQPETGTIPVYVTNLSPYIKDKIETLVIAVWNDETQRDLQWIGLEAVGENEYLAYIDTAEFSGELDKYYIDVHAIEFTGQRYIIGSAEGILQ